MPFFLCNGAREIQNLENVSLCTFTFFFVKTRTLFWKTRGDTNDLFVLRKNSLVHLERCRACCTLLQKGDGKFEAANVQLSGASESFRLITPVQLAFIKILTNSNA